MKVYKTKDFNDWAKSLGISDFQLFCVALEIKHGLINVQLGRNLIKQRIGLNARGKSSGARAFIAYKDELMIFLFGLTKSKRENISKLELISLKHSAEYFLNLDSIDFMMSIKKQTLIEVKE